MTFDDAFEILIGHEGGYDFARVCFLMICPT